MRFNRMTFKKSNSEQLRDDLREAKTEGLALRRTVFGLSLVGMASMTAVSFLQMGMIRHLPDPPIKRFDSDAVNLSDTAYQFGIPDGPVALASLAANALLAAFGGINRARTQPWIPLVAAGKAAAEAVLAGRYLFYEMPIRQKKWCGYCITGALVNFGVLAFTLPEAREALPRLFSHRKSLFL